MSTKRGRINRDVSINGCVDAENRTPDLSLQYSPKKTKSRPLHPPVICFSGCSHITLYKSLNYSWAPIPLNVSTPLSRMCTDLTLHLFVCSFLNPLVKILTSPLNVLNKTSTQSHSFESSVAAFKHAL